MYRTFFMCVCTVLVLVGYPFLAAEGCQTEPMEQSDREVHNIIVDTNLYTATFCEEGGVLTSFVLKEYKEVNKADSPGMQIIRLDGSQGYPLGFTWGNILPKAMRYTSDSNNVTFQDNKAKFVLQGKGNGLEVTRTYRFSKDSYFVSLVIQVKNVSSDVLHGAATLHQFGSPAVEDSLAKRFLFSGPAYYAAGSLVEIDGDTFKKRPLTVKGQADWIACECNYFMNAVVLEPGSMESLIVQSAGSDVVEMTVVGTPSTLQPGEEEIYRYRLFIGPKKLKLLKASGFNLDKAINYGWFDSIARPTLSLLNFFYGIVNNYGIAIILVTIIFKAALWPITRKGMRSMKNMQKLQPEMARLKEKYKNEPAKRNQAVGQLYKKNKVNPLVGCFPMLLQMPIFFALYEVLFMAVELRHAPFMLWINDLSAPDRLYLGFDIPYVGGLPVLTLLMGASMFVQQKMATPKTVSPAQAKVMLFLPVLFTFMFVNFASGLVLYWLVNNLLTILQYYVIDRKA